MLAEPSLYVYTGGSPPTVAELRARYARQARGHSDDGSERWLNWIVRERATGTAVGTVQATVARGQAEVAWVVGAAFQGRGFATEAARAMGDWLRTDGVGAIVAHVHPQNLASAAVARRLGLLPTTVVVDGETRWRAG